MKPLHRSDCPDCRFITNRGDTSFYYCRKVTRNGLNVAPVIVAVTATESWQHSVSHVLNNPNLVDFYTALQLFLYRDSGKSPHRCRHCGRVITSENIGGLTGSDGDICVCCSNASILRSMTEVIKSMKYRGLQYTSEYDLMKWARRQFYVRCQLGKNAMNPWRK